MSSYEEKVVDQGIDQAWSRFAVRLGDWCASSLPTERFGLDLAPDVAEQPWVEVERIDDLLLVAVHWPDDCLPAYRRTAAVARRLVDLDFFWVDDMDVVEVELDRPDRAAHLACTVLRDVWGTVHPSFVTLTGEDAPDLLDERQPIVSTPTIAVPQMVEPASRDDLHAYVVAVLQQGRDAPLKVADDGAVSFGDGRRTTARIWVPSSRRVEVWTILAHDVRRKAARREVDRLSIEHPTHRFYLVGRRLIAETCLDARPLVGRHLQAALRRTIRLHHGVADELQETLSRCPRVELAEPEDPAVDPHLLALVTDSRDLDMPELMRIIERAVADELLGAERWLAQAGRALKAQRDLMRSAPTRDLHASHLRAYRRWERMITALRLVARDASASQRGDSRPEAS